MDQIDGDGRMTYSNRDFTADLKKRNGILILGHRGCRKSTVPENTTAAFKRALGVGADGIEIDVESTRDGRLVVVNRWFLKFNFGFFPWERSCEEIRKAAGKKEIPIPEFDEVCRFMGTRPRAVFNVEIKSSSRLVCKTAVKAAKCIHRYGLVKNVVVSSFDLNTLLTLRLKNPEIETAYLFRSEDRTLRLEEKKTFRYKVNGILNRSGIKALFAFAGTLHPETSLIPENGTRFWQRLNRIMKKRVNTWTVDSREDFNKAVESGAECIISDSPELMIAYRNATRIKRA